MFVTDAARKIKIKRLIGAHASDLGYSVYSSFTIILISPLTELSCWNDGTLLYRLPGIFSLVDPICIKLERGASTGFVEFS